MTGYTLIRSDRRTLALQVTADGVTVRAPRRASKAQIDGFVEQHRGWIEKRRQAFARQLQADDPPPLTQEELRRLIEQARETIPQRVAYYAPLVGVTWERITVRRQRTKWGSCSGKGNLNFNCLLMLAPPEVLDCIVVHELCHRLEMNHSARFYAHVYRVFPDYDRWNRWLKDNGWLLLRRLPTEFAANSGQP